MQKYENFGNLVKMLIAGKKTFAADGDAIFFAAIVNTHHQVKKYANVKVMMRRMTGPYGKATLIQRQFCLMVIRWVFETANGRC